MILTREMVECFKSLGADGDIRAIVVSGRGKIFTVPTKLHSNRTGDI